MDGMQKRQNHLLRKNIYKNPSFCSFSGQKLNKKAAILNRQFLTEGLRH
jgi:hypothetical protein